MTKTFRVTITFNVDNIAGDKSAKDVADHMLEILGCEDIYDVINVEEVYD